MLGYARLRVPSRIFEHVGLLAKWRRLGVNLVSGLFVHKNKASFSVMVLSCSRDEVEVGLKTIFQFKRRVLMYGCDSCPQKLTVVSSRVVGIW